MNKILFQYIPAGRTRKKKWILLTTRLTHVGILQRNTQSHLDQRDIEDSVLEREGGEVFFFPISWWKGWLTWRPSRIAWGRVPGLKRNHIPKLDAITYYRPRWRQQSSLRTPGGKQLIFAPNHTETKTHIVSKKQIWQESHHEVSVAYHSNLM